MTALPAILHEPIQVLLDEGDNLFDKGKFEAALAKYEEARAILPSDPERWEATTWILTAIGDTCFLMGDCLPWTGWGIIDFYDHNLTGTLWNAYLNVPGNFDLIRHKGSMNGLFLDGHVESFPITQSSLSNYYLAQGISTNF